MDTPNPANLSILLARYRKRIRRERRLRFVAWSLLAVSVAWLTASLLYYFDAVAPALLPTLLALTVALPIGALVLEAILKPSLSESAALLDKRLDDRQRLVTSVELLSGDNTAGIASTQLHTTTRLLGQSQPKAVYPVRAPWAILSSMSGLLILALGLYVLKGAGGGFAPIAVGTLPPDGIVSSVLASPTPQSGLPASELTPEPTPTGQPSQEITLDENGQPQEGTDQTQSTGPDGQPVAAPQDDVAASQQAQEDLDRLGEALDRQSVTQPAGDALRQGNAQTAAEQLRELGQENDQLSEEAKQSLADALQRAAQETGDNPLLRQAENQAADALRDGDYKRIQDKLDQLAEALEQTAAGVMSQDELAQNFPEPTAQAGDDATSEGEEGSGKQGSEGQQQEGNSEGEGSSPQGEGNMGGQSSDQEGEGQQPGMGGAQSQNNEGEGQSGSPGQGSSRTGPADDTGLNLPGNPFELDPKPDPNNTNPQNQPQRPGLELEGGAGQGSAAPVQPGGSVDAPGESTSLPLDRWDIIRRYFSPDSPR